MKKLLTLILFIFVSAYVYGQGICRGKITDEKGEPLVGAQVYLKGNTSIGTITDFDGNYSLSINISGSQTLVVSFVSFTTIEESIEFKGKKVIIRNYVLKPVSVEIEDVVVKGRANRANDAYMQAKKIQSAISIDYISAETLKKTGDSNIQDAVKRVSGISTIGSFITVRGLADRYIKTTVNGSRVPTLDAFTNNIKLDIFPTSLIDNVVISKTASANLPSDWSGAYLSIETKDYPNKFTLQVKSSFGYNNQSTFEDIVSSKKSPTDWLGFDNGFRDIEHHGENDFPSYHNIPTFYQQYMALDRTHPELGLADYISSLGINETHLSIDADNIYNRLMLVQMGLLAPGLIDDPASVDYANSQYNQLYGKEAFFLVNDPAAKFGQSLPNNWNIIERKAPINFSQEFSLGDQTKLFGKPLGYIIGLKYSQTTDYDPRAANFVYDDFNPVMVNSKEVVLYEDSLSERSSSEINSWSALVNLAYKFSSNHSVSLLFMPNFRGVNKARYREGVLESLAAADNLVPSFSQQQLYEERQQLIYQYKSTHYFPRWGLRIEANASFTDGKSNIPDFKQLNYGIDGEGNYSFPNNYNGSRDRIFRILDQDIWDLQLSAELPIIKREGLSRKLMFGGAYQDNSRDFSQYTYRTSFNYTDQQVIPDGDFTKFFAIENFRWNEDSTRIKYSYSRDDDEITWGRNFSTGYSRISAAYAMFDFEINHRLRISAGVRAEHTEMFSDQIPLLGQPNDSEERKLVGSGDITANPSDINELHILPSSNIIFKLSNSDKTKVNVRLNYSKSIARPNTREISYAYLFDYELRKDVVGNTNLKITSIDNYDFRIETFFNNGDNISISLFYKDFFNFIEFTWPDAGPIRWINKDHAWAGGIELEARKKIFKNLEVGTNITLVESETVENENDAQTLRTTRPLFGQAPYIINGLLSHNWEKARLSTSISYNIQGPKLDIVSGGDRARDIYEMPRHLLDFKISKNIGEHFNISLKVRDILQAPDERAYKADDFKYTFDKYTWGTDYVFSFSYTL